MNRKLFHVRSYIRIIIGYISKNLHWKFDQVFYILFNYGIKKTFASNFVDFKLCETRWYA